MGIDKRGKTIKEATTLLGDPVHPSIRLSISPSRHCILGTRDTAVEKTKASSLTEPTLSCGNRGPSTLSFWNQGFFLPVSTG